MSNSYSPAVRHLCARYRTQSASVRQNAFEGHTLTSLSQRLLLSPQETLHVVSRGDLISLSSANGKHVFSARALDGLRDRIINFIRDELVEELEARGFSEDRILMALSRAFQKQHELSRGRGENIVEFARTPSDDDDDDHTLRNAALLAGGAAAGYGAYRYLKGQNNGNGGNALPGGAQPQLPPGPSGGGAPRTPRDPNSSATGIDTDINGRHPGPPAGASLPVPITTQSPRTLGGSVIDPLTAAVQRGKAAIARRGSSILAALKNIPWE